VIAARLTAPGVHPLLHDRPFAIVCDHERVQVEIVAVLDGCAVDFGHQAAGARQCGAVDAGTVADRQQFVRRTARMASASAADMQAELAFERRQTALQRSDDAGRDAGGMPVHSHHRAERLKPEWMRQTAQQLIAPVVMDDRLDNDPSEAGHTRREPCRHMSAVQGQVGATSRATHAR
jgi:hypothetical protein